MKGTCTQGIIFVIGVLLLGLGINTAADSMEISIPYTLNDVDGFMWDVRGDGNINNGSNDAYDGGLRLSGFPSFSTATLIDERELVIGPSILGNISITRRVYVPADGAYARFLEVITNTGSTPASYSVRIDSNMGSDSGTTLVGTSDGDSVFSATDNWLVTDDTDGSGDPTVLHVVANDYAMVRPSLASQSSDSVSYTYDLELQPGETQVVMHFGGQSANRATALEHAASLEALEGDVWARIPADLQGLIVNFGAPFIMGVQPYGGFESSGYSEWQNESVAKTYTLRNFSQEPLAWELDVNESWITASASSGVLGVGGSFAVTVTINEQIDNLAPGSYQEELVFRNLTGAESQTRTVDLSMYPAPQAPTVPHSPIPDDGAQAVEIGVQLDWAHANEPMEPSNLVSTQSVYSVYLGTDAQDMQVVASGLTNSIYDPGLLDVDTTYYWQVSASNAIGVTAGPVWDFTTWEHGALDHFEWILPEDGSRMTAPFDVTLKATDVYGTVLTSYTNRATLTGLRMSPDILAYAESFEDGNKDWAWSQAGGSQTASITSDISADGSQSLVIEGSDYSHSRTYYRELSPMQPTELEFYVRADNTSGSSYIVLGDENGHNNSAVYFYLSGSYMRLNSATYYVSTYQPNQWYKINLKLDWEYRRIGFYVDDNLIGNYQPFESEIEAVTRLSLYNVDKNRVWYDGIRITEYGGVPIEITPTTTTDFVSGVWTGSVTASAYTEDAFLRATDAEGLTGDSELFTVDYLGSFYFLLPGDISEGNGVMADAGQLTVSRAPETNLVVNLSADAGGELSVPAQVVIPAGETSVQFDLTVSDDASFDGSQYTTIHASSFAYRDGSRTVAVHDNEVAELALSLPETTVEGAGQIAGVLTVDPAPSVDVQVPLITDNYSKIYVSSVTIPAGQTFVPFTLWVGNNNEIDGVQTAVIETMVPNWINDQTSLFIFDDESTQLSLQLPSSAMEGDGIVTNAGLVVLAGRTISDVQVALTVSDSSECTVPAFVTIPAGESQASFDLVVIDDSETDGSQQVSLFAHSVGFVPASSSITVEDNDIHHLVVDLPAGDHPVLGTVALSVSARTVDNLPVTDFAGPVTLSATGDAGAVPVTPSNLTTFFEGAGTELISFGKVESNVVLTASDDTGLSGTSTVFNVSGALLVLTPDNMTNTLVVAGETLTRTMVITNAGNVALEYEILGGEEDGGGAPQDSTLVAHFPFNGNANDETGKGNDGTVNGATLTTDRFGNANAAYDFDGLNDYIDIGNCLGTENTPFTVSAWMWSANARYQILAAKKTAGLWNVGEWQLSVSELQTSFGFSERYGNYLEPARADVNINDGVWHHVCGVMGSNGSELYIDGVQVSASTNVNLVAQYNSTIQIGAREASEGRQFFDGKLDDLRIYNRALSSSEISDLYTEDGDFSLLAHFPFNGNANDESGNGHDGTVNGAMMTADRHGSANSAYSFDGTDDYIDVGNVLGTSNTPFTVSAWMRSSNAQYQMLVSKKTSGEWQAGQWQLLVNSTYAGFWFGDRYGTSYLNKADAPVNLNDGVWHHLCGVMGADGLKFYIDGTLSASTPAANLVPQFNSTIHIGDREYSTGRQYFDGELDDVSIYNRALSAAEIAELYDLGDNGNGASGPMARYTFDGNAFDLSGNEHDGTVVGATLTTDRQGNADSAYSFDGVNDYIDLGSMGDFKTVSLWVNQKTRSGYDYYLGHNNFRLYASTAENGRLTLGDGSAHVVTPTHMDDYVGQWAHVVAVKDGADSKLYLNGVNVTTSSGSLSAVAASVVNLGRWPGNNHYFHGAMDDVQIYDRVLSETEILDLYSTSGDEDIDAGLVAHYPYNGNAEDESGNGYDGTVVGAGLTADRFDNADSAYDFNGDSDYIDVGNSLGTEGTPFTVSAWMCSTNAQYQMLVAKKTAGSWRPGQWHVVVTETLTSFSVANQYGVVESAKVDINVHDGVWHHVCGVMGDQGSRLYIDGALVASNLDALPRMQHDSAILVGARNDATSRKYFDGKLDDLRIYNRALSAAEIAAVYEEAPVVNPNPDVVAHFPFSGNADDASGNGNDGTVHGATLTTDRFGNSGNAYAFNGTNAHIVIPDTPAFTMSDTTVAAWIKTTDKSDRKHITSCYGTEFEAQWYNLLLGSGTGVATLQVDPGGSIDPPKAQGTTDVADGNWHFVVGVRDTSTGQVHIYVDGVLQGSTDDVTTDPLDPASDFWIGGQQGWPARFFNGAIDDVRIYSRALTNGEITELYEESDPDATWLKLYPKSGSIPPGGVVNVMGVFNASGLVAGDYTNANFTLNCNDVFSPSNALPVSMWVLPPAPVMLDEPGSTTGTANTVAWTPVEGSVEYLTEVLSDTNAAALQLSGWISTTNHTFSSLSPGTVHYYHTRASVVTTIGRLDGPWSDWVQSRQLGDAVDLDGDLIPDAWEVQYFGAAASCDPLADSDGDGQSNRDEYIAGMDPTNPDSFFMVRALDPATNGAFIISWDAVTGRVYSVQWKASLPDGYQTMGSDIQYPQNSYTDTVHSAESQGFYSLEVEVE